MLERSKVLRVLKKYGQAWMQKNPDLIVSLFTPDAVYHEQVMAEPIVGLRNIRRYWRDRVVRGQSNIQFRILNVYIDGNTAIAEWEAQFDVRRSATRKHIREVAILEFRGEKIRSLREYWASKSIGLVRGSRRGRQVR